MWWWYVYVVVVGSLRSGTESKKGEWGWGVGRDQIVEY